VRFLARRVEGGFGWVGEEFNVGKRGEGENEEVVVARSFRGGVGTAVKVARR